MPQILAVLSEKGGSGKSVIATNLAWTLHQRSSTLLVDGDPQQSSLDWSDLQEEGPSAVAVGEGSLHDVPRLASEYEYVVIDGAPRMTDITREAVQVADLVVIPVHPAAADIWSSETVVDLCETHGTDAVLCLSRTIVGTTLTESAREALESFDLPVLDGTAQRVAYVRSFNGGSSVIESSDKKAAQEILDLTEELTSLIDTKTERQIDHVR